MRLKKSPHAFAMLFCIVLWSFSCSSGGDDSPEVPDQPDVPEVALLRATLTLEPDTVEEGGDATVTLSLDAPNATGGNLSFPFAFDGTVDPTMDIVSLVSTQFVIANGETSATIDINTLDDDIMEEDETFTITLGDLPNGTTAGERTMIILTLTDND